MLQEVRACQRTIASTRGDDFPFPIIVGTLQTKRRGSFLLTFDFFLVDSEKDKNSRLRADPRSPPPNQTTPHNRHRPHERRQRDSARNRRYAPRGEVND